MDEIKPNGIYTTKETREYLKVSESTLKRLIKKGILRAAKIGHQHRILGREILRLVVPKAEQPASRLYQRIKKKGQEIIKNW
jgi:excisionase family DNA binding protein